MVGQTPRVLVAEDETLIAMGLVLSLKGAGFHVRCVANGRLALAALDAGFMPDVILTDYMMPVLDGAALIEIIRQNEAYNSVQIIMLSAVPPERVPALAKYDVFMSKPVRDEELIAAVRKLLGAQEGAARVMPDARISSPDRSVPSLQRRKGATMAAVAFLAACEARNWSGLIGDGALLSIF